MSTGVVVREARQGDHEFILSLATRLAECDLPRWRTPEEVETGTRRWLEVAIGAPSATSCILVAERADADLLGFIFIHEQQDFFTRQPCAHISDIAVTAQAEGTGAGSLLMTAAERWAQANGYRRIELNVFAGNERAREMYDRLGYAVETVKYVKLFEDVTPEIAL